MRSVATTILFAVACLLLAASASAQISLNDLPQAQGNSRFYDDPLKNPNGNSVVEHPSLTLNGFDSEASNSSSLGLKQVLEKVYNISDPTVVPVWDDLVSLASGSGFKHSPSSRGEIIGNTQRMQARAFLALATYVMERNGESAKLKSPTQKY
jgi:hypothetical protein